jgi:invasion protein IalB
MRNIIVGVTMAAVLVAALFAVAHFHPAALNPPTPPAPDPAKVAARLKPDFVGTQQIGAWRLNCGKPGPLPPRPVGAASSDGNAVATPPQPPVRQYSRCRVILGIHSRANPAQRILVGLQVRGPRRDGLLLVVEMPGTAWRGDAVILRLSTGELNVPVRLCGPPLCLAILNVPPEDVQRIFSADKAVVVLPSLPGAKPVTFAIPTTGLRPALVAMHRIDR